MRKRPRSITIIAWLFLGAGAIGLVYHATEFKAQHPFEYDIIWVCIVRLLAILSGVFMLRGSKLGALASTRLARIPRHPQRVSLAVRVGNAQFTVVRGCIFFISPAGVGVFSRCECGKLKLPQASAGNCPEF